MTFRSCLMPQFNLLHFSCSHLILDLLVAFEIKPMCRENIHVFQPFYLWKNDTKLRKNYVKL